MLSLQLKLLPFILLCVLAIDTLATQETLKSALKTNGQLLMNQPQKSVESIAEVFEEGTFYGRLRNNNFYFSYDNPDSGHERHLVSAVGASLIYTSASLHGFDITLGLYGSKSFFNASNLDSIAHLKPAKDTLSRFDYVNTGSTTMGVIGQANLGYSYLKTRVTLGRQLVETFYTKSNDTKMIPNTFDGLVIGSQEIAQTQITVAYLIKQKLRDHTSSHSLLMVGDANSSSSLNPQWSENDDGAMHKGLTYTALKAAGKPTDAPLIVLDVKNRSITDLHVDFSSYIVPQLLSQVMGELNYNMTFGGITVTPGIRYIQQFDNGAGRVGGASLYGVGLSGYDDAFSLDSKMVAARIVTKIDDYKINLGYSYVLDEADLVTPWRGFPTSGYTRSMGVYNWRANTKSYRIELVKGATNSGVYTQPFIQTSILYTDADQDKLALESLYYYGGIVQNIPTMPQLQYRVRVGYRDFIGEASAVSNYIDSRVEFNYLF
jgi:hypothetical protein